MNAQVFHPLKSTVKTLLLISVLSFLTVLAVGQTNSPAPQSAAKSPAYEVVSVKPAKPDCPGMSISMAPGRFMARCITPWGLLYNAYEVRFLNEYPPGLPDWADKAKFDVDAKMDEDAAAGLIKLTQEERGKRSDRMLQSLLADRFNLRVHYESRELPIYALVAAKGGPKLKPWPTDEKPRGTSWGHSQIRIQGGPIGGLVTGLSNTLSRTVVDQTGLAGNYDINLKWTPDEQQGTPDAGPTLFTALQEQLGLRLKPDKGPVQVLVVDHIEQPSEN
jgi:uncharacterized protein (TIGR03435 family)